MRQIGKHTQREQRDTERDQKKDKDRREEE